MTAFDLNSAMIQIGAPALLIGLLLGALITWLIASRRHAPLEAAVKNEEALQRERNIAFETARSQLTSAFTEMANQSLKSNSENFLRLAEQNLGAQQIQAKRDLGDREKAIEDLVKPIRDALQASQKQITELEKTRSEAYGGIKSQLEAMQLSQQSLTQETQNLVKALRRPEVRGRWGEITLRRLVELAGMVEHCDFQEQVHSVGDDQVIRPDMVVRMPNQRDVVVDVKTPLDAYLEAVEAKDDTQRQLACDVMPGMCASISERCRAKRTGRNLQTVRNLSSFSFRVISS